MIFNEAFWIFAISWTSGIFSAAAFATFGPTLERLFERIFRRGERRVRSLGKGSDDWQPGRFPRRRA